MIPVIREGVTAPRLAEVFEIRHDGVLTVDGEVFPWYVGVDITVAYGGYTDNNRVVLELIVDKSVILRTPLPGYAHIVEIPADSDDPVIDYIHRRANALRSDLGLPLVDYSRAAA